MTPEQPGPTTASDAEAPLSDPHSDSDQSLSSDFYQRLRQRVRDWLSQGPSGTQYAEVIFLAPDLFHLLCRLSLDPRIPPAQKAKVIATIAYFIVPIGVVPEALVGPLGYIDDVALAAYVLSGLLNSEYETVVREHWAGQKDILSAVQGVLQIVESAIGQGLWRRLKGVRFPRPLRRVERS